MLYFRTRGAAKIYWIETFKILTQTSRYISNLRLKSNGFQKSIAIWKDILICAQLNTKTHYLNCQRQSISLESRESCTETLSFRAMQTRRTQEMRFWFNKRTFSCRPAHTVFNIKYRWWKKVRRNGYVWAVQSAFYSRITLARQPK